MNVSVSIFNEFQSMFILLCLFLDGYDNTIDEIYRDEFSSRLETDLTYLDHAGATLYTQSQLNVHFQQLQTLTLSNPHSEQDDSTNLRLIRECIEFILSIFDTSTRDYAIIFTLNATHACQLLSSLFPFTSQSEYAYMIDSHNSLIGIRQRVHDQGGLCSVIDYPRHIYEQSYQPEYDWSFRSASCSPSVESNTKSSIDCTSYCLFAMPAENNFNGLRPPLQQLLRPFLKQHEYAMGDFPIPVHHQPSDVNQWLTLVDCAKYLSTKTFSLATYPVDFVVLSFYKIFGYPTGLGALIIRNSSLKLLNRQSYFGGGSVRYVSPCDPSHVEYKQGIDAFIHGTIPFTSILALHNGFRLVNCTLSYRRISLHTQCLSDFCRNEMLTLIYDNGQALCLFYDTRNDQLIEQGYSYGPILNFNLYNSTGEFLSCRLVQRIAADHKIVLRAGTFCAPGASQAYLGKNDEYHSFNMNMRL
jgi:molybdenum cofactor sulfurtransferase